MLSIELNAKNIKEQVSIVDVLASLGFQPISQAGHELLYLCMLRDTDTRPSLSVNKELNVWYDHGTGNGGNIIDFAMVYWKLTFIEALKKIAAFSGAEINYAEASVKTKRRHARKVPYYQVEEIKPLGNNDTITEYLKSREIWETAQNHLSEIYYYVEDECKNRKQFFAAGWQNELGSWEVRNLYFKGCLGHKAITFISREIKTLVVFEGFFNYLSWLADNPFSSESILILNSANLVESAIRKAKDFLEISVFFDRDYVGRLACEEFLRALPLAIDQSIRYKDHNDYNEMLVSRVKRTRVIYRGT